MRSRKPFLGPLSLATAIVLAGCSMIPDYERPAVPTPAAWQLASAEDAAPMAVAPGWWTRFGSAELDALMDEATAANHDLAAAMHRIDQARATVRVSTAPLLPTLDGSGSGSRENSRRDGVTSKPSNQLRGGLTAAYELDLWGRNRAGLAASEARLEASRFDYQAVALALQSDLATTYAQGLTAKDRLAIARQNLAAARELLRLVESQFEEGAASALEVAQQRAAVAQFEAQIPQLAQQLQASEHAVAILLGRAPGDYRIAAQSLGVLTLPSIAPGQPSRLLERRPDVARAEANLIAANADIGAARAAFFPSVDLSLGGTLGYVAGAAATGGTTGLLSLAGALSAPIFSGGRLEGELDRSKASKAELAESYQQTVLTAFREVADALVGVNASEDRQVLLASAAEQARTAFRLSQARYRAGTIDFLTVLDAQRTQLSAEDSLVQADQARYGAAVDLFRALGGGWRTEAPS